MKKILIIIVCFLFSKTLFGQIIDFEDNSFKTRLLQANVTNNIVRDINGNPMNVDTNNDYQIQISEVQNIGYLDLSNATLTSIGGINYFNNLISLNLVGNESLEAIYIDSFQNLTTLTLPSTLNSLSIEDCLNLSFNDLDLNILNNLNYLKLKNIPMPPILNLSDFEGSTIIIESCSTFQDIQLPYTGIPVFKVIDCDLFEDYNFAIKSFDTLEIVNCTNFNTSNSILMSGNQGNYANFNGCSSLGQLSIHSDYSFFNLNIDGCNQLEILDCSRIDSISMNIPLPIVLKELKINNSNIEYLDLTGFNVIESINLNSSYSNLTTLLNSITLPQTNTLKSFSAYNNLFSSIDFSPCIGLESINISSNNLTEVILPNSTNPLTLSCSGGSNSDLVNLDFSQLNTLVSLNLANMSMTTLDLSGNTLLGSLDLNGIPIDTLNLNSCTNLEIIDCYNSGLKSINVSGCTNLKSLYCGNNDLETIDLSQNNLLTNLGLSGNNFTSLSIHDKPNLVSFNCYGFSNLIDLELSNLPLLNNFQFFNNPNLETIDFTNIHITSNMVLSSSIESIILNNSIFISTFTLSNNSNLTNLVISNSPQLTNLAINNNNLSELHIDNVPNLVSLNIDDNILTGLDLSGLPNLQTLSVEGNRIIDIDLSLPNNLTKIKTGESAFLESVNLSGCTQLDTFICHNSHLAAITSSSTGTFNYLELLNNKFVSFDLGNFPMLKEIVFASLEIQNFEIGNHENIEKISIFSYNLNQLNISNCTSLNYLNLNPYYAAPIPLDLTLFNLPQLEELHIKYYQIEEANIANSTLLKSISLEDTNINELNIQNLNLLESLKISGNNISTLNLSNIPLLKYLDCSENNISMLELSNLDQLEVLLANNNPLTEVNILNNPELHRLNLEATLIENIDFSNNSSLQVVNIGSDYLETIIFDECPNLEQLFFHYTIDNLISISAVNCSALYHLDVNGSEQLQSINLEGCSSLHTLWVKDCSIGNLNLAGCASIFEIEAQNNQLVQLDVSDCTNLGTLKCQNNNLSNLDLSTAVNLNQLNCSNNNIVNIDLPNSNLNYLYASFNQLTELNFQNNNLISILECDNNQIDQIDVSNLENLNRIKIDHNNLSVLELPANSIDSIWCNHNNLTNLDVSQVSWLRYLNTSNNQLNDLILNTYLNNVDCSYNNLEEVSINEDTPIVMLNCSNNNLTELEVNHLNLIESLDFSNNAINEIDLTGLYNLNSLNCSHNNLTTLDLSYNSTVFLNCENNILESIYMRNESYLNSNSSLNFNPNLQYVCCDQNELNFVESLLESYGLTNYNVNSTCPAAPGVFHSIFTSNSYLDLDGNGCDDNDIEAPFVNFVLSGSSFFGTVYADITGQLNTSLVEGNYTITPQLEYPDNLSITPVSTNFTFDSDPSEFNQDFCISIDQPFNDVEVDIFNSTIVAGFDASSTIIIKNNGVEEASGEIAFNFEDDYIDYVSSTPLADEIEENVLKWSFSDLQPFETRVYKIIWNTNPPNHPDFPLLINDKLSFNANVTPLDNDIDLTNNYAYSIDNVYSSYDPNDKKCIQGNILYPDMIGDNLTYKIRFENTGNYYAQNIVVVDIIDQNFFDISTLNPIAGSHDFITKIEGNKVEFIFEDIELPFVDDENDGWVLFKIKTWPTLAIGDEIKNTAEIYFDFNPPIITNEETTVITTLVNTFDKTNQLDFSFSPNPTQNILNIESNVPIRNIEIRSIDGRRIYSPSITNNIIDVRHLESGVYILKVSSKYETKRYQFIKY